MPADGEVRLEIFDAAGRRVRTLVEGWAQAGVHRATWDGRDDDGREAASGIYLYRLRSGAYEQSHKMVLMR